MSKFFGGAVPYVKMIAIVIVGLFIFKVVTQALANHFPNGITNGINKVVQAA